MYSVASFVRASPGSARPKVKGAAFPEVLHVLNSMPVSGSVYDPSVICAVHCCKSFGERQHSLHRSSKAARERKFLHNDAARAVAPMRLRSFIVPVQQELTGPLPAQAWARQDRQTPGDRDGDKYHLSGPG